MERLNIAAIEQQARRLRAAEMQRIHGLISARLFQYGQLLGATLLSALKLIGESLRPMFSWNPRQGNSCTTGHGPAH